MKRRGILVAGVRFLSRGAGRYYSACGRWGIFHMNVGRVDHQWELYELSAEKLPANMLDAGLALTDIVIHGTKGDFKLI